MVLLRYLDFCTRCVTARTVVEQPLRVFDSYSTGVLFNGREKGLTATNGKIDEGRSVSVWKWLVVMVRFECVIARCLRPPIVACVYIHES